MTVRSARYGVLAATSAVLPLSGCASPSSTATRKDRTSSSPTKSAPLATPCGSRSHYQSGTAFAVSIAEGVTGYRTPQLAAATFGKFGGEPGYESAVTRWTVRPDQQGVTLYAAAMSLHVVQLRTGGWVVDSGARCS